MAVSSSLHTFHFLPSSSSDSALNLLRTHEALTLLSKSKTLGEFKQVHAYIVKTGLHNTRFVLARLVELCALSPIPDGLPYALSVFDGVDHPSPFTWNTIIRALSLTSGDPDSALGFYVRMLVSGADPNSHTFPVILKLCAKVGATHEGRQVHSQVMKLGICSDAFVTSSLISMYAHSGELGCARKVFDRSPVRNAVCFTALMSGYASRGRADEARAVFDEMGERDVVAWNAMVSGYVQSGRFDDAFGVFHEMLRGNVRPNESTVSTILSACAQSQNLEMGNWVRSQAKERGLDSSLRLVNSLVDMYSKCGDLNKARELFDGMNERNVVSWNVMIGGYTHRTDYNEALSLFRLMLRSDFEPNDVTLLAVLPACAHAGALDLGKWIHAYIDKNLGTSLNASLRTSLVDMYAKCGDIEAATQVFDAAKVKSLASWNAMLSGLATNGHAAKTFELFSRMVDKGFEPDDITFVAVLSACNHAGSLDAARRYFASMARDYNVTPKLQHYGIMTDLLGRAGLFEEAEALIGSMEMNPDGAIWGALLRACRVHNRVELGESIAERLFELEPENPGPYVLLSNIYAGARRWDDVARIRTRLHEKGMRKVPGCTSIEVDNVVHEFLVGDKTHPLSEDIYKMLEEIDRQLEMAGFVADTSEVLYEMDEELKEGKLSEHSEKLAIAFGLIRTKPGTTIRVVKNLRVCGNCHSATKLISKIFGREIIARDRNRFHHFKDGSCSCNDYW